MQYAEVYAGERLRRAVALRKSSRIGVSGSTERQAWECGQGTRCAGGADRIAMPGLLLGAILGAPGSGQDRRGDQQCRQQEHEEGRSTFTKHENQPSTARVQRARVGTESGGSLKLPFFISGGVSTFGSGTSGALDEGVSARVKLGGPSIRRHRKRW